MRERDTKEMIATIEHAFVDGPKRAREVREMAAPPADPMGLGAVAEQSYLAGYYRGVLEQVLAIAKARPS